MLRASAISAASYRIGMLVSVLGLFASIVPLYFVSTALQGVMASKIQSQGGQYFAFVLVGTVVLGFVSQAVNSLPNAVQGSVGSGMLDTLLSVPASPVTVFTGLTAYGYVWTFARSVLTIVVGVVLGAQIAWSQVLPSLLILALIVLSYVPFGLLAAALIVAFRTDMEVRRGVLLVTTLLGGVYYPTEIIPSWIRSIADVVPLTYGLRALRRVLLDGGTLWHAGSDIATLVGMTVVLAAVSLAALSAAFQYARRTGTLAQY
jgi:ABC-2 type transport system permease protein